MTLYIYDADTLEIMAEVIASTNAACEALAQQQNYNPDQCSWTYNEPMPGIAGSLIDTGHHDVIRAEQKG